MRDGKISFHQIGPGIRLPSFVRRRESMHPRNAKTESVQSREARTTRNSETVTIMPIDAEEARIWDQIVEMKSRGR
jgi:hypothetical protein